MMISARFGVHAIARWTWTARPRLSAPDTANTRASVGVPESVRSVARRAATVSAEFDAPSPYAMESPRTAKASVTTMVNAAGVAFVPVGR
jgi:hypothetical protein